MAKIAAGTSILVFFIDLIRFLAALPNSPLNSEEKGQLFLRNLLVVLTTALLSVPGGLPLAVLRVLAFVSSRLAKSNITVRVLNTCEAIGSTTTVCTEKTGYLTQNRMNVVVGTLGVRSMFYNEQYSTTIKGVDEASTMNSFFATSATEAVTLLRSCISSSSTAFEEIHEGGKRRVVGSETESSLLRFARDYLSLDDLEMVGLMVNVIQFEPYYAERKYTACVVRMEDEKGQCFRLYAKGASELLLKQTTRVIDSASGTRALSSEDRQFVEQAIITCASDSLCTIALVFRDFLAWPPEDCRLAGYEESLAEIDDLLKEMTLIGLVGIHDPLRPGINDAISSCVKAGVSVKLVTGEHILAAKKIASDCGIFTPGGIVMTGRAFQNLSVSQMKQILPRLQVLARSTPESKRDLVAALARTGQIVTVTGDDWHDRSAMKFDNTIGLANADSSEAAKEASSMILNDDGFIAILTSITWGRCVVDSVRMILQVKCLNISLTKVSNNSGRKRFGFGACLIRGARSSTIRTDGSSASLDLSNCGSTHESGPRDKLPGRRSTRQESRKVVSASHLNKYVQDDCRSSVFAIRYRPCTQSRWWANLPVVAERPPRFHRLQ
jgi:P-type Ca2+ transporter type 2C